ncbi:phthioceranic/hydroxyphthioceranic acid synthase-like [Alosa pseudoharengus]|uniref:phthioceranic/hydroxyphthioceranic acid synthase-like n=1 Tax=Alosa pseudoharengus TaxID=34774 RepID=UPI003F8ACD0D
MDDIAVVGIGCNFPGGEGLDNFWKVLVEGKNCAIEIPDDRFDCASWYDSDDNKLGKIRTSKAALVEGLNDFDHKFFGITDAEASHMDPQQKLLLQCSYRALENAGIPMEKASGTRTGVFVGLMNRDFEMGGGATSANLIDHWTGTGVAMSIAANRISYMFNFTGPSLTIDSACSSSLVALHLACQALRQGDCHMAVCGGVCAIFDPIVFVALSKAKMISPDGTSKPFSSRADGYGRGEGCGVVLLKPLKQALQDFDNIWGIISKTAVNQDGHSVSPMTKPSMIQQEELLHRIYSTESDLTSVQYIEAHGTGTPVGDPIEAGSISNVIAKARPLGSDTLIIGSVKSNIGHTESAAGVAGLIKVLLMMKHETIVPSVFYSEDSSSIDAKSLNLKVPTKAEPWKDTNINGRVAGINNFGFGGTNAHVVVKQYKRAQVPKPAIRQRCLYFVLSAASEKSLSMMIEDTLEKISNDNTDNVSLLAYTSSCRRSHLKNRYRVAFLSPSLTDLQNQLKSSLNTKIVPSVPNPRLVFVFCGNGVTYRGMCRQLLKEEPIFREKVQEIETLFQSYKPLKMIEALESDNDNSVEFSRPDVIQPLLFAIQVAIYCLLKYFGVKPDSVLGYSVGEVAAAHCSGLLSLEDAVKVIHYRSALQSKVTGGKMLVVSNMAVSEVLKSLPSYSGKVCLAAHNSPQSCTLSGDADAIASLHQTLSNGDNGKNLFLHVLDVPAAYHSHTMDPILSEVEKRIGSLEKNEKVAELYSTVSGKISSTNDFCTGAYWSKNIRDPVLFEQTLMSAAKDKNTVFVEIGPRRALQRNIIETLCKDTVVLSSVLPDRDHETVLSVAGKLFELGVHIDWGQFYKGYESPPTVLPRYQFDVERKPLPSAYKNGNIAQYHPVLTPLGREGTEFSCDLFSDAVSYLHHHKNNDVAIIPGAFHIELGLASFLAHVKPRVTLNALQLSISFESPFLLTKNPPELKVKLEPGKHETMFKVQSNTATYASGVIECKKGRVPIVPCISIHDLYKRCNATMDSENFYRASSLKGFQYTSVFRNKADVHYGEEYREALTTVTVPEELLPQLHDYCIHPVILDYALQLAPVTVAKSFIGRSGFPSSIGAITAFEPLQDEMVIYLRTTVVGENHIEVCGCFASIAGKVLVEIQHMMIKYLGRNSEIVEELFYHNEFIVISENPEPNHAIRALVFADHSGIAKGLQQHLNPESVCIPFRHAKELLSIGLQGILSKYSISDIKKNIQEILFIWSELDLTVYSVDDALENLVMCCEAYRRIALELKTINFPNPFRTVTYRSAEGTVDHISPGFVLSGLTRGCAAEISNLSFQLIDMGSDSEQDIRALAQVLTSYPCSKYPELVVKNGQILQPQIVHTLSPSVDIDINVASSKAAQFMLQTADPFKMSSLSALISDREVGQIPKRSVKVKLTKICVHTSNYFPVSVTDLKDGDTMYWSTQTKQNHKLLALDFSGTVTAVGKEVSKLKVGDHIAACYPATASSEVIVPEATCYRTKHFPFLREIPCMSYFALAWAVLHHALPKVKQSKKMIIFSPVPDSGLLKVLNLTANRSGWDSIVSTELGCHQDLSKIDTFVLLPPFGKHLLDKVCKIPAAKYIVAVCEKDLPSHTSTNFLTEGKDYFHIQTLLMHSILGQSFLKAHTPNIYKWLKSLHLTKQSFNVSGVTFQRPTSGSTELPESLNSHSYLTCATIPTVVLKNDNVGYPLSDIPLMPKERQFFQKNSVYIVAGGLTGLGFETVKFIALRGGGHIVILSRRNPTLEMQHDIDGIKQQGGVVIVSLQCDVSQPADVEKAITYIEHQFPSSAIRGVFHSAVVLHDGLIETLNKSLFEKVLKPKVNGVLNLHRATKHCKLDYFVCYSSISSFIGNASQTNYAAANSFLDSFCHYRRRLGLAAQSINWGALNLGLLLNKDHFQRFLEARGLTVMNLSEIQKSLEECLLLNKPQQVICKFNFKNMIYNVLSQNVSLQTRLYAVVEDGLRKANLISSYVEQMVSPSSPDDYIKSLLSETINVQIDELSEDRLLSALGLDSMLAMTLQNLIYQGRGVSVPLVKMLDPNSTVATLVEFLSDDASIDSGTTVEISTAL